MRRGPVKHQRTHLRVAQTRSLGLTAVRIIIILCLLGLVLPRLLGAIVDYVFSLGRPASEATLGPAPDPEREVYRAWFAGIVQWWQQLRQGTE